MINCVGGILCVVGELCREIIGQRVLQYVTPNVLVTLCAQILTLDFHSERQDLFTYLEYDQRTFIFARFFHINK